MKTLTSLLQMDSTSLIAMTLVRSFIHYPTVALMQEYVSLQLKIYYCTKFINVISISADMITPHTTVVQPTMTVPVMTSVAPSSPPINANQSKAIVVAGVAAGTFAFIIIVITITAVVMIKYRRTRHPSWSCEIKTVASLPLPDSRYV